MMGLQLKPFILQTKLDILRCCEYGRYTKQKLAPPSSFLYLTESIHDNRKYKH